MLKEPSWRAVRVTFTLTAPLGRGKRVSEGGGEQRSAPCPGEKPRPGNRDPWAGFLWDGGPPGDRALELVQGQDGSPAEHPSPTPLQSHENCASSFRKAWRAPATKEGPAQQEGPCLSAHPR